MNELKIPKDERIDGIASSSFESSTQQNFPDWTYEDDFQIDEEKPEITALENPGSTMPNLPSIGPEEPQTAPILQLILKAPSQSNQELVSNIAKFHGLPEVQLPKNAVSPIPSVPSTPLRPVRVAESDPKPAKKFKSILPKRKSVIAAFSHKFRLPPNKNRVVVEKPSVYTLNVKQPVTPVNPIPVHTISDRPPEQKPEFDIESKIIHTFKSCELCTKLKQEFERILAFLTEHIKIHGNPPNKFRHACVQTSKSFLDITVGGRSINCRTYSRQNKKKKVIVTLRNNKTNSDERNPKVTHTKSVNSEHPKNAGNHTKNLANNQTYSVPDTQGTKNIQYLGPGTMQNNVMSTQNSLPFSKPQSNVMNVQHNQFHSIPIGIQNNSQPALATITAVSVKSNSHLIASGMQNGSQPTLATITPVNSNSLLLSNQPTLSETTKQQIPPISNISSKYSESGPMNDLLTNQYLRNSIVLSKPQIQNTHNIIVYSDRPFQLMNVANNNNNSNNNSVPGQGVNVSNNIIQPGQVLNVPNSIRVSSQAMNVVNNVIRPGQVVNVSNNITLPGQVMNVVSVPGQVGNVANNIGQPGQAINAFNNISPPDQAMNIGRNISLSTNGPVPFNSVTPFITVAPSNTANSVRPVTGLAQPLEPSPPQSAGMMRTGSTPTVIITNPTSNQPINDSFKPLFSRGINPTPQSMDTTSDQGAKTPESIPSDDDSPTILFESVTSGPSTSPQSEKASMPSIFDPSHPISPNTSKRLNIPPGNRGRNSDLNVTDKFGMKFKCVKCKFKSKNRLSLHLHYVISENMYICVKCGAKFSDETALNIHLRLQENLFYCVDCRMECKSIAQLTLHDKGLHTVHCCLCEQKFHTLEKLKAHLFHHHKYYDKCRICDVELKDDKMKKLHMRVHVNGVLEAFNSSLDMPELMIVDDQNLAPTMDQEFSCAKCSKVFKDQDSLLKHLIEDEKLSLDAPANVFEVAPATKENNLNSEFKDQDLLLQHVIEDSLESPANVSEQPPAIVTEQAPASKENHSKFSGGKFFPCVKCSKMFPSHDALFKHFKEDVTHRLDLPITAPHVGEAVNSVNGQSLFCLNCSKVFDCKDMLLKHLVEHEKMSEENANMAMGNVEAIVESRRTDETGTDSSDSDDDSDKDCLVILSDAEIESTEPIVCVRNYRCFKCKLNLKSEKELKKHLLEVEDIFFCLECDKKLPSLAQLLRHEAGRHVCVCQKCGHSFVAPGPLYRHLLDHHKGTRSCLICLEVLSDLKTRKSHLWKHALGENDSKADE